MDGADQGGLGGMTTAGGNLVRQNIPVVEAHLITMILPCYFLSLSFSF